MVMPFTDIFETKVVDSEDEEDKTPFVTSYARGGGTLLVSMFVEAFSRRLLARMPD